MPEDSDMKEQDGYPNKFNIGTPHEDLKKFREDRSESKLPDIGATEEDIEKFQKPVYQSELPDVRMQRSEEDVDLINRERENEGRTDIRVQDPYFGINRNSQRIFKGLALIHSLEKIKEIPEDGKTEEQKKIKVEEGLQEVREKLPVYYERLMTHHLTSTKDELENEFLRLRNPVPYETRTEDYNYANFFNGIRVAMEEEKWAKSAEAKHMLLMMQRDVQWIQNNRELLKGMAGGLDKFYDWSQGLSQVSERFRIDPITQNYELTFSSKYRGEKLPFGDKASESMKIREHGVKYHSDNRYWSMAAVAAHQTEFVNGKRKSRMGKLDKDENWVETIGDNEYEFVQKMFGMGEDGQWTDYSEGKWAEYEKHRFPHKMLNWQAMKGTQAQREIYIATMSELLTRDVKNKFKKGGYQKDGEIDALVSQIKESVKERRKHLNSRSLSLEQTQAIVVVESGIVFDWGHHTTVHTSWGYDYEKDEETGVTKRGTAGGGTTEATDVATGIWWREFKRGNAGVKGWSTGPMPDMSQKHVEMLAGKPPDFRPTEDDLSKNAAITGQDVKSGQSYHKSLESLKEVLNKVNPELWPQLEKRMWYWETKYKNKHGRNIVVPVFSPPTLESVNYWHTIPWDPKSKIKPDKKEDERRKKLEKPARDRRSVWEALQEGELLSDKEWGYDEESLLHEQAYYKHLITLSQIQRLNEIVNVKPEIAAQSFSGFFEKAENIVEFMKRADLAVRDERDSLALINTSMIPMLITAATAKKRGIFSEKTDADLLGSWVAGDVEEWKKAIMYNTPDKREGVEGYKETMAAFLDFYSKQFALIASGIAKERKGHERKLTADIIAGIKADTGVKIDQIEGYMEEESGTR